MIFCGAQQASDALPGGEDAGDNLAAAYALELQHRVAALRRERPEDRGDVLVGRDLVLEDQDVVGVLGPVALEKAVEILVARRAYFSTPA